MICCKKNKRNVLFKKFTINTLWLFFEQLLRIFSGFFVGIAVARYLGPEDFGFLSYVGACVSLFVGFVQLGLNQIVARVLVEHQSKIEDLLGTAFWMKIIGAIVGMALISIYLLNFSNDSEVVFFVVIASFSFLFQSFDVIEYYFQSQVLGRTIAVCKFVQLITSSILKMIFIFFEFKVYFFVFLIVFDAALLAFSYFYLFKKKINILFFNKFDLNLAKKLLNQAMPLFLSSIAFSLFSNIDAIMIKSMLNNFELGVYMAAYRLSVLWYFLPGLVLNSVLPALVSVKNESHVFYKRLNFVCLSLMSFALFLAVFTNLFSGYIISQTYGKDFSGSIEILNLLIWINIFIFLNSCWNTVLVIYGETKKVMFFHFLVMGLTVLLNFILIPKFGGVGAAYSILLSLAVSSFIFLLFDRTLKKIVANIFFINFIFKNYAKSN